MTYRPLEKQIATVYPSKDKTMGRVLNTLMGIYGINPKRVNEGIMVDTLNETIAFNNENVACYRWIDGNFPAMRFYAGSFRDMYERQLIELNRDGTGTVNLRPVLNGYPYRVIVEMDEPRVATPLLRWLEEHVMDTKRAKKAGLSLMHPVKGPAGKVDSVKLIFAKSTGIIDVLNYINRNFEFTNKAYAREFYAEQ